MSKDPEDKDFYPRRVMINRSVADQKHADLVEKFVVAAIVRHGLVTLDDTGIAFAMEASTKVINANYIVRF
jgi:hypothetical protein